MKTSNLSAEDFKKARNLFGSTLELAIWSCDTGQRIPCFDSCQLTTTWMCNITLQASTLLARTCGLVSLWYVTWLPKFLEWIDNQIFLATGLRLYFNYDFYLHVFASLNYFSWEFCQLDNSEINEPSFRPYYMTPISKSRIKYMPSILLPPCTFMSWIWMKQDDFA